MITKQQAAAAIEEEKQLNHITGDDAASLLRFVTTIPESQLELLSPSATPEFIVKFLRSLEGASFAGAPLGPPDISWLEAAGTLEELPGKMWNIRKPDGATTLYADPADAVAHMRGWLSVQDQSDRYCPLAYEKPGVGFERPAAPLIISGLVKTGKTFSQTTVLPAVVAQSVRDGEIRSPAPVLLQLSGTSLDRSAGARAMLCSLLRLLLGWARQYNVPVERLAWHDAVAAVTASETMPALLAGEALLGFFRGLRAPVLVLIDEFQTLLQPETVPDAPGVDKSVWVRDTLVKQLLMYGPRNVAWCITGSSMALTWLSIASMPPNGLTLITGNRQVELPADFPVEHMDAVWEQLVAATPALKLVPRLLELAEPMPAMLTMLAGDWAAAGGAKVTDLAAFVGTFVQQKLVAESRREWATAFRIMSVTQRMAVYDMSSVTCGCGADIVKDPGLWRFLGPYLKKTASGRFFLASATQRQLIQLIVDAEGKMRLDVQLHGESSLAYAEARVLLLQLGEVTFSLKTGASKAPPEADLPAFWLGFEALASDLSHRVFWKDWPCQDWFQRALLSTYCSVDRAKFSNAAEQAKLMANKELLLAFYLRLVRHALAHDKPWRDKLLPPLVASDLLLLSGLSNALGISLTALLQRISSLLALLGRGSNLPSLPGSPSPAGSSSSSSAAGSLAPSAGEDAASSFPLAAPALPADGGEPSSPSALHAALTPPPTLSFAVQRCRHGGVGGRGIPSGERGLSGAAVGSLGLARPRTGAPSRAAQPPSAVRHPAAVGARHALHRVSGPVRQWLPF